MLDMAGQYSAEEAREAMRREYGTTRDAEPKPEPEQAPDDEAAVES